MRWLAITVTLTFLGCAAPAPSVTADPAVFHPKVEIVQEASFNFTDLRPPKDRSTRVDSDYLGTRTYLADDAISPAPPALVTSWLQAKVKDRLASKSVALQEFTVLVLEPAQGNSSLASGPSYRPGLPANNLLHAAVAEGFIEWLSARSTSKLLAVRIEVSVGERRLVGVSRENYKSRVTLPQVYAAIEAALDDLANDASRADDL